jgi:hypothetical protein
MKNWENVAYLPQPTLRNKFWDKLTDGTARIVVSVLQ